MTFNKYDIISYPEDFNWGVSTSSYQIEGAWNENGRTPSVWDAFCRREGVVANGDTGDTACNHYHRYRDDVELMQEMLIRNYRMSISWPRVLPEYSKKPNEAGLDFYDCLVDELLNANISPWVTLFHWDFPQYLYEKGGWLSRNSVDWFADYTAVVIDRLSDRVKHWITINEPQCFLHFGHGTGTNAPGDKLSLPDQLLAAHHVLLAHGRSVAVIREKAKLKPLIGWAPVGLTHSPTSDSLADVEAAKQATMSVDGKNLWNNVWFSDPVFKGQYPEEGLKAYGTHIPEYSNDDLECISAKLDFLGLNIYTATPVEATDDGWQEVPLSPGAARTNFDWPVREECLYWGPRFHHERYGLPIVITENGMANVDWLGLDGRVRDPQRIDYTRRHLLALNRSISDGVDVQGYFHWSLMDNFEWAEGFSKRFGLVYVDFGTGERTMKDSAYWYRDVIRSNGKVLSAEYSEDQA